MVSEGSHDTMMEKLSNMDIAPSDVMYGSLTDKIKRLRQQEAADWDNVERREAAWEPHGEKGKNKDKKKAAWDEAAWDHR